MRLVFLGTGGYHPNERRHTAGVLLPEIGVLFDAGTGLFRIAGALKARDLQIFLTHAHLDHVVGLTYLLRPMHTGRIERVRVYATAQTLRAVREHLFSQPLFPVDPGYEYIELEQQVPVPNDGLLTHCRLNHPGGSTGYKIVWPDRSIAYITDTTVDEAYVEFVRGVDVLIHECYFPDSMSEWAEQTGHSVTTQVAKLAAMAGVGRLLLVHVDPDRPEDDPIGIDAACAVFPRTQLAEDLQEIEF